MFDRTAGRLALAIMLLAAAPAGAEEPNEIIVIAQRANATQVDRDGQVGVFGDRAAADVPFSVKSFNEALILNQQPLTLGQVLENDPSIRTTYGFGNAAEQFVIRGFPLYGDDVGLDGLYGITPRQLIAPELYDRVEVLNGASAFLNGAAPGGSGIGGSVNLRVKRAGSTPVSRLTVNYVGDRHYGGSADFGRRFGSVGLRLNAAYRAGDVAIDDEFRRAAVIGGALDYDGGPLRLSLDLAYQRFDVRRLRPKVTIGTTTLPAVPRAAANYGQSYAYSTLKDVFGTARAEYDLANNALLYASFGARDGSERGIYDGITVTNAATGAATGNALFVPRTDNNEAATLGLRVKLARGGVTSETNLGGSSIRQVNRNAFDFLYGPGFAGFATNLYRTPQVALPSSSFVGGNLADPYPIARIRLNSLYASNTFGLFGDRLLATAGFRLQRIKVVSYSYFGGAESGRYDEDAITPVLGLVVKPTDTLSLFANRIEGLTQGPVAPLDANVSNPGEVFAPAKSRQYEVGGKLALGRVNASLALYRIERPSAFSIPDAARPGFQRFGVFGQQRNRGIEFSIDGEPAHGLRVIAGATLTDAKLRRTGNPATDGKTAVGVPEYTVNANVEYDLPFLDAATLTARVVHTGPQQVNAANTLRLPTWTRVDLGARYVALVADNPLTLRLTVDNVANRRYWASAFDVFGTALLQGQPRTLKLSASVGL